MVFAKKEILLKDGRACILRPAQASDAQAMLDYLRAVSAETPFLLRGEEEITDTLESEERLLEQKREDPREMMMVAEADGWIAGNCAVLSYGSPRRAAHRCGFAIAVRKAYWGLGLGSAMLGYACSLAQTLGYEQMELEVVEGNERAQRLYERYGFEETGKIYRALKYADGAYRDEYRMVKVLNG